MQLITYFVQISYFDEDGYDFREINGDMTVFNSDEAKTAWEKGLSELGVTELSLEILGGHTELFKKMDEYFKSQLETNLPGLTISLKEVPFSCSSWIWILTKTTRSSLQDGADYQDPYHILNFMGN